MSQSQEAANAVRDLERQRDEANRKAKQLHDKAVAGREALRAGLNAVRQAQIDLDNLVAPIARAERELGQVEGMLASMRNPRGYGGAPTLTDQERAELDNYRQVEGSMMGAEWRRTHGRPR